MLCSVIRILNLTLPPHVFRFSKTAAIRTNPRNPQFIGRRFSIFAISNLYSVFCNCRPAVRSSCLHGFLIKLPDSAPLRSAVQSAASATTRLSN
jgi:hypothetical protein